MTDKEYVILYTNQKTKKAKTWHDGVLKISTQGTRAILYDDKGSKLDSIYIRSQDVVAGEQLESDRYFIQVEEEKNTTKTTSVVNKQPISSVVPTLQRSRGPGLKRKGTGFVPPRMVKQQKQDPDPISTLHQGVLDQHQTSPQARQLPAHMLMNLYSTKKKHSGIEQNLSPSVNSALNTSTESHYFHSGVESSENNVLSSYISRLHDSQNSQDSTGSSDSGRMGSQKIMRSPWSIYGSGLTKKKQYVFNTEETGMKSKHQVVLNDGGAVSVCLRTSQEIKDFDRNLQVHTPVFDQNPRCEQVSITEDVDSGGLKENVVKCHTLVQQKRSALEIMALLKGKTSLMSGKPIHQASTSIVSQSNHTWACNVEQPQPLNSDGTCIGNETHFTVDRTAEILNCDGNKQENQSNVIPPKDPSRQISEPVSLGSSDCLATDQCVLHCNSTISSSSCVEENHSVSPEETMDRGNEILMKHLGEDPKLTLEQKEAKNSSFNPENCNQNNSFLPGSYYQIGKCESDHSAFVRTVEENGPLSNETERQRNSVLQDEHIMVVCDICPASGSSSETVKFPPEIDEDVKDHVVQKDEGNLKDIEENKVTGDDFETSACFSISFSPLSHVTDSEEDDTKKHVSQEASGDVNVTMRNKESEDITGNGETQTASFSLSSVGNINDSKNAIDSVDEPGNKNCGRIERNEVFHREDMANKAATVPEEGMFVSKDSCITTGCQERNGTCVKVTENSDVNIASGKCSDILSAVAEQEENALSMETNTTGGLWSQDSIFEKDIGMLTESDAANFKTTESNFVKTKNKHQSPCFGDSMTENQCISKANSDDEASTCSIANSTDMLNISEDFSFVQKNIHSGNGNSQNNSEEQFAVGISSPDTMEMNSSGTYDIESSQECTATTKLGLVNKLHEADARHEKIFDQDSSAVDTLSSLSGCAMRRKKMFYHNRHDQEKCFTEASQYQTFSPVIMGEHWENLSGVMPKNKYDRSTVNCGVQRKLHSLTNGQMMEEYQTKTSRGVSDPIYTNQPHRVEAEPDMHSSTMSSLPHPTELFSKNGQLRIKRKREAESLTSISKSGMGEQEFENSINPSSTDIAGNANVMLSGYKIRGSVQSGAARKTMLGTRTSLDGEQPFQAIAASPFHSLEDKELTSTESSPSLFINWNGGKPCFVNKARVTDTSVYRSPQHAVPDRLCDSIQADKALTIQSPPQIVPHFPVDESEDEELYSQLYKPRLMLKPQPFDYYKKRDTTHLPSTSAKQSPILEPVTNSFLKDEPDNDKSSISKFRTNHKKGFGIKSRKAVDAQFESNRAGFTESDHEHTITAHVNSQCSVRTVLPSENISIDQQRNPFSRQYKLPRKFEEFPKENEIENNRDMGTIAYTDESSNFAVCGQLNTSDSDNSHGTRHDGRLVSVENTSRWEKYVLDKEESDSDNVDFSCVIQNKRRTAEDFVVKSEAEVVKTELNIGMHYHKKQNEENVAQQLSIDPCTRVHNGNPNNLNSTEAQPVFQISNSQCCLNDSFENDLFKTADSDYHIILSDHETSKTQHLSSPSPLPVTLHQLRTNCRRPSPPMRKPYPAVVQSQEDVPPAGNELTALQQGKIHSQNSLAPRLEEANINTKFKSPVLGASLDSCKSRRIQEHFRSPMISSSYSQNMLAGSKRSVSGELMFPSKTEVESNADLMRQIIIPVTFSSVAVYKQVLISALKECLNLRLFDLGKQYHHALSKANTSGYNVINSGSLKLRKQAPGPSVSQNPQCQCGVSSKMIQVKKPGNNQGRFFYACSAARNQQCKFFQWADAPGRSSGFVSGGNKLTLSDAASITTYMRDQHIIFYCECNFVRKSRETITAFFKGNSKWAKKNSQLDSLPKRQTFLRLPKKDASSLFSKDDIWIVSKHLDFEPSSTFLARGTYFGPNSNNEVEIEPLVGFSPSNWQNEVGCHAILAGNASSELGCIQNIENHLQAHSPPVLPHLLQRITSEQPACSDGKFKTPSVPGTHTSSTVHVPAISVDDLARDFVSKYKLNVDQAEAVWRVAGMFSVEKSSTVEPLLLIHGVFGAGKSYLLSVVVLFLVAVFKMNDQYCPGEPFVWKLLISSTTNVAVDRILSGLLELGFEDFIRVGSVKKIAKPVLPYSVHTTGTDSQELKDLQEMLRSGELTPSEKQHVRKSIEKHRAGENKKKLGRVRVVGATCASCVFSCLSNMQFPLVMLDECSQMTEPASLLPVAKFDCRKMILVGDPKQLDPTIQGCEAAHQDGLEQTLFDRLTKMGYIPTILRTQYRCHPRISTISNQLFYGDMLIDGVTEEDRQPLLEAVPTLCFYDVGRGQECNEGGSYYNEGEAQFVAFLIELLLSCDIEPASIGVITLYKAQMFRITDILQGSKHSVHKEVKGIQVSTVDAFQGGEREVIILSCVRTQSVGFIDSDKRTNVALSRAKNHLLIVGNQRNLSRNQLWGRVIGHCKAVTNGIQDSDETMMRLESVLKLSQQSTSQAEKAGNSSTAEPAPKRRRKGKKKLEDVDFSPPLSLTDTESQSSGVSVDDMIPVNSAAGRHIVEVPCQEACPSSSDKRSNIDTSSPVMRRQARISDRLDPSLLDSDKENSEEDLPKFDM